MPRIIHVLVLEHCDKLGCDLYVDCHGDEELPYNFISGSEGCSVWSKRMATLQNTLCMEMMKVRGSFYCHRIIFLVFTYPAIPYILYIPSANSLLCTMMCYI